MFLSHIWHRQATKCTVQCNVPSSREIRNINSDQHHLFVGRNDPNRCCSLKVEIENIWKISNENELIGRVGILYWSMLTIFQMMNINIDRLNRTWEWVFHPRWGEPRLPGGLGTQGGGKETWGNKISIDDMSWWCVTMLWYVNRKKKDL